MPDMHDPARTVDPLSASDPGNAWRAELAVYVCEASREDFTELWRMMLRQIVRKADARKRQS